MQIDVMLISSRKVFHFEIKNFLQNYLYENGTWMCNGREIGNDFFIQMKRAWEFSRKFTEDWGQCSSGIEVNIDQRGRYSQHYGCGSAK